MEALTMNEVQPLPVVFSGLNYSSWHSSGDGQLVPLQVDELGSHRKHSGKPGSGSPAFLEMNSLINVAKGNLL